MTDAAPNHVVVARFYGTFSAWMQLSNAKVGTIAQKALPLLT